MNYTLSTGAGPQVKRSLSAGLRKFAPLFAQERTDSAADTTRSAHDSAAPPPVDEDVTAPRSPRASG